MVKQKEVAGDTEAPSAQDISAIAAEFEGRSAEEVIRWALDAYGSSVAVCSSFQAETMAILDIAHRIDPEVRIFTVDTGRLPQETYDLIDKAREHYGILVKVHYPDADELAEMVGKHGINPFYRSVSLRLMCCGIRKVNPVDRALKMEGLDAWITGLRRSHGEARLDTPKVEVDAAHGGANQDQPPCRLERRAGLAIHQGQRRALQRPFTTRATQALGGAPCTRATEPGEDPRAGRWWWEKGMPKECGIHPGLCLGPHGLRALAEPS